MNDKNEAVVREWMGEHDVVLKRTAYQALVELLPAQAAEPATTQAPSLTDEQLMHAIINACDSLNITRVHELGGKTRTIAEEAGLLEIGRAVLALAASVPSTAAPWPMEVQPDGNVTAVDPSELKPNTAASVTQGKNCAGAPGECDFNGSCMYSCKQSTAAVERVPSDEQRIPRGEADYALMNQIMKLSCEAATANAQANSDDGHIGTEASGRFIELRRQIWTLIANKHSALAQPEAAGQAEKGGEAS